MLKRLRTRILRSLARLVTTLANSLTVLAHAFETRLAALQDNVPDAPADEAVAEVITQSPQAVDATYSVEADVSTAPVVSVQPPPATQDIEPRPQQAMQTASAQAHNINHDSGSIRQIVIRETTSAMDAVACHGEQAAARMASAVSEVIPARLPEAGVEAVQLSQGEQTAIDRMPQADTGRAENQIPHTHKPASNAADDSIENNTVEPAAGQQNPPYPDVPGLPPPVNQENVQHAMRERAQVVTLDFKRPAHLDAGYASEPDFSGSVAANSGVADIAPAAAVPEAMQFAAWCTAKTVATAYPRREPACPWPELLPAAEGTPPSQHLQWPFALEQKLRAVQHVRDMTHEQAGKVWNA